MENIENLAVEKTKELLEHLGLVYSDVFASFDKEDNTCSISIKGDNLGILIGFHGKNLEAMKVILSLLINKNLDRDNTVRVVLDINDYADKRKEQLRSMIENARTVMTAHEKSSYSFPPMSAADRRIIHTLAQEMGLKTQSDGEGVRRHVNLIA